MVRISTSRLAGVALMGATSVVLLGGAAHAADAPTSCATVDVVNPACTAVLGETFTKAPVAPAAPAAPVAAVDPNRTGVVAPTSTSGSGLPFTGADIVPLVAIGGVLLAGGSGFVALGSRRRRSE